MSAAGLNVIIVGGGASGALLAISLLRAPRPMTVTIVESRPLLARGFAYGEAAPFHLLNVRAANMSAHQDEPDHLLEWLDRKGDVPGVTGGGSFRFVPRRIYGDYLAEQLDASARAGQGLQRIQGEAISLTRTGRGISIGLRDGRRIEGDIAVIATGYALRSPSGFARELASWTPFASSSLTGLEHVLILGTGHSAVDHVQLLIAAGYKGKITMLSRHGFLPAVHHRVEPAAIDAQDIPFGARMSEVWRWVRQYAAAVERKGGDWRSVLDGLRPRAQALWQSLSVEEQRRFIRHARAWYDVRRHRLAPSIGATLERLTDSGRLEVVSGRLLSVTETDEGAVVAYRRRGTRVEQALTVQGIIECVGFDLNPRSGRNPLLLDLLAKGLAQEGPHGLGLSVSSACAVVDTSGRPATDLYAIGPLTRGQFWEVVGLPDIRQQCAGLALELSAYPNSSARAAAAQ